MMPWDWTGIVMIRSDTRCSTSMNGMITRNPGDRGPAPAQPEQHPLLVLLHDPRRQGRAQQEQHDDDSDDNQDFHGDPSWMSQRRVNPPGLPDCPVSRWQASSRTAASAMTASQAEKLKKPARPCARNWLATQAPPSAPVKQVRQMTAAGGPHFQMCGPGRQAASTCALIPGRPCRDPPYPPGLGSYRRSGPSHQPRSCPRQAPR
jgi:hypothetical protein